MSLNARTKELLDRARRDAEPTADELRQVRARLAPRLATEEPALTAVPLAFLKVAAAVAVAAAGVGAWQWTRSHEVVAPPVAPSSPPVASVAPQCPPVTECPAVAPPPACPPAPARAVCPPASKAGSERAKDDEGALRQLSYALPQDAADRWALEVGLLVDARVALDEGRALDALGHAQRHERLFPESAFREERLAVEVMATCQVGRPDAAKAPLRALLTLEPASTYFPRIRSACGWADLEQAAKEDDDAP